ncbi:spore germination protein [Metabacillus malikii]|uniref:Spore germination protein KA n=1 Tax=Metabacillus malikii TaxID=1504265 RepID=A0ABT9ZCJ4_9BACI|nr:spore germination protein [Metabacillus malikii]MDQ0229990.1 spore germination protein KA [Metabacillus malikii]
MKKLPFFKNNKEHKKDDTNKSSDKTNQDEKHLSWDIQKDVELIKEIYSVPENIDFVVREFTLKMNSKKAAIFFIPSLTDVKLIEEQLIKPLILHETETEIPSSISISSLKEETSLKNILKELNSGETVLLVEGEKKVHIIKSGKVAGRSVEKPQNETTLLGPKESFIEKVDVNISLIRKKIKSEDFKVEKMTVGKRSNNDVFLVYNKQLANKEVLKTVKSRLSEVNKDAVQNLGLLVQLIEDRKTSLFPTILQTERPDRAVSYIEDGHIILIMNNSPFALVTPATFWTFLHSADDHYLRFIFGNFTRFLRLIAVFITLFLPSIYISITNYHREMLPADLLLAIAGAREMVPFPAILELLLMELAFELIREAGIRVPAPIGPTIGIVGALILGQAAVEANVVSPIVVIVVAMTGLSSFAISDVNLNYAIRISRFGFFFAASFMGIFGMVGCFLIGLYYVTVFKSFGVPYFAPLTPTYKSSNDTLFRKVLKSEAIRPGYLKTKDLKKGVK